MDLYWASASGNLCHEQIELVGDEIFTAYIDFKWQNIFLLENNLNYSVVYSGNYLSLKCSFRKLSQAESLTEALQSLCFPRPSGMWQLHIAAPNEETCSGQLRLRNSTHHNKLLVCCVPRKAIQIHQPLLSIQISKKALHAFLITHLPPKLTRPEFKW